MSAMRKLTVEIPEDLAAFVDAQVAAGHYASADEVFAEGLMGLAVDDAELEEWIEAEVMPVYERVMADPSELLSHRDVFDQIEAKLKTRRAS